MDAIIKINLQLFIKLLSVYVFIRWGYLSIYKIKYFNIHLHVLLYWPRNKCPFYMHAIKNKIHIQLMEGFSHLMGRIQKNNFWRRGSAFLPLPPPPFISFWLLHCICVLNISSDHACVCWQSDGVTGIPDVESTLFGALQRVHADEGTERRVPSVVATDEERTHEADRADGSECPIFS